MHIETLVDWHISSEVNWICFTMWPPMTHGFRIVMDCFDCLDSSSVYWLTRRRLACSGNCFLVQAYSHQGVPSTWTRLSVFARRRDTHAGMRNREERTICVLRDGAIHNGVFLYSSLFFPVFAFRDGGPGRVRVRACVLTSCDSA